MTRWWENFFDRPDAPAPRWARGVTILFLCLLFSLAVWTILSGTAQAGIFWSYRIAFLRGWLLTLELSVCSLVLSSLIGVTAALARRSRFLPLRYFSLFYVELIRGTPFLVLILVLFYGIPQVTQYGSRFFFGVVALSLFAGAYIAEMVRAGIESVSDAQWESARAIGLTTRQAYRYVVFPQAFRQVLPPLAGQFASLIKDSSLLSIIGLSEFTHTAQEIFSVTYAGIESFLPLAVGYLILTLSISVASRRLEERFRYQT